MEQNKKIIQNIAFISSFRLMRNRTELVIQAKWGHTEYCLD